MLAPGVLLTDLYELTMLQAYWTQRMNGAAVFELFVRRLPAQRNFLLASGLTFSTAMSRVGAPPPTRTPAKVAS